MKINKEIIKAVFSTDFVLIALELIGFIFVQSFYPKHSAIQAVGLLIAVLATRILFKISKSNGDTQIIEQ